jgi:hypothetical protein
MFDHIDTQNDSYLSLLILAQLNLGFSFKKKPSEGLLLDILLHTQQN